MAGTKVSLLFIIGGGDDSDRIVPTGSKLAVSGTTDLTKLLLDREPHHRLHVTRNYFRQSRQADLSQYTCLVNLITEPEQNARVLENLRKVLRGLPGRVINRPEAVLRSTRDQVARLLTGIPGLNVPKAVRLNGSKASIAASAVEKAGIFPPVILREVGTHTGKIVGLFDSIEGVVAALEKGKEYFATQFVDFAGRDGLYRKCRVYFIGGRVILRHMFVSNRWNVHVSDRARFMSGRPETIAEERALFESAEPFAPEVKQVFSVIRERMPLDFFGMDFAIAPNGNVILFEANATMSFFPLWPGNDPQFEYLTACFAPAQAAFRELLGLAPQPAGIGAFPVRLQTG
jgi:glutathione synthase/RimK-type ligase-like ATP-grasp enzyme